MLLLEVVVVVVWEVAVVDVVVVEVDVSVEVEDVVVVEVVTVPTPGHESSTPSTGFVDLAMEMHVAHPSFGMNPVWKLLSTNWKSTRALVLCAVVSSTPRVPVIPKLPGVETPEVGGSLIYHLRDGVTDGFRISGQSLLSIAVDNLP